jgi:hypothetical protein
VTDSPALSFDIHQDRRLIWYRGDSVRYLSLTIATGPPLSADAVEPTKSFNVGLAIDVSTTMSGAPLDAAKQVALAILAGLDDSDCLSIISFSQEPSTASASIPVGPNRPQLQQTIRHLETGSESDFKTGWLESCLRVAEGSDKYPQAKTRLFLLSDGQGVRTGDAVSELAQHARELEKRRLPTAAIGIGNEVSIAPLMAIDDRGGNWLATATSPNELGQMIVAEYLSHVPGVVIDASVELVLPPGVRAQVLPDLLSKPLARPTSLGVGDLQPNTEKHHVVKLIFPKCGIDDLLDVRLILSGLDGDGQDLELVRSVQYRAADGHENSPQQRDEKVAKLVLRTWVSSVLSNVLKLHEEGNFQEISPFINNELRFLNGYTYGREEWSSEIARLKAGLSMLHRPWRTR